jgi:hypothetical protein
VDYSGDSYADVQYLKRKLKMPNFVRNEIENTRPDRKREIPFLSGAQRISIDRLDAPECPLRARVASDFAATEHWRDRAADRERRALGTQ